MSILGSMRILGWMSVQGLFQQNEYLIYLMQNEYLICFYFCTEI